MMVKTIKILHLLSAVVAVLTSVSAIVWDVPNIHITQICLGISFLLLGVRTYQQGERRTGIMMIALVAVLTVLLVGKYVMYIR